MNASMIKGFARNQYENRVSFNKAASNLQLAQVAQLLDRPHVKRGFQERMKILEKNFPAEKRASLGANGDILPVALNTLFESNTLLGHMALAALSDE